MKTPALFAVALLAFIVFQSSVYKVSEVEQAIITRFGKPVGEAVKTPGLKFKLPFIEKVHRFEKRWLEWDGAEVEMPTKEKTYIYVDSFARWRIVDPLKFYMSVVNEDGAQTRLDAILDSETRDVIAGNPLIEVVRSSNRPFQRVDHAGTRIQHADQSTAAKTEIKVGRDKLTRMILEKAAEEMPNYGIEMVDIQFQRVNYTESVKRKVFDRMISERKSIAAAYRSEGEGESARIRGDKDRDKKTITSEAYLQVEIIKGTADATATDIYAEAYNRDPKLYRLVKTLASYANTIDEDSTVVLSSDSDYFKIMTDGAHN